MNAVNNFVPPLEFAMLLFGYTGCSLAEPQPAASMSGPTAAVSSLIKHGSTHWRSPLAEGDIVSATAFPPGKGIAIPPQFGA